MKIALVYDKINKWGGAERILLTLHKLFPNAPLYTSNYDKKKTPWANVFTVRTSFLQKFPFATHHELYALLMPLVFESFNFDEFDLVISVTSEAAKGIITKPQTKHICYCLTPTRYLWSGYGEYFKNPILRFFSFPAVMYLKFWDKIAAKRPDKFIAISKEVQGRIRKYYNRDSEIVYPSIACPVGLHPRPTSSVASLSHKGTSFSEAAPSGARRVFPAPATRSSNNYFLIVSRLVPYKKIGLAIKTFNKLGLSLKIVGTGSEMKKLKAMSGPTIEFLGHLTDKELVGYYSGCRALIFPGLEDLGLTILEAQSFGKPVIAFRGGGAIETIIEKKTGIFFDKQNVEGMEEAIRQFSNLTFDPKDCIEQARKFSFDQFKEKFMKEILK
jgi:glycosyltransferase involved in cell wall biosynthesis